MRAIDGDAHVIETVQTWSYLAEDERRFTPQLMTNKGSNKGSGLESCIKTLLANRLTVA